MTTKTIHSPRTGDTIYYEGLVFDVTRSLNGVQFSGSIVVDDVIGNDPHPGESICGHPSGAPYMQYVIDMNDYWAFLGICTDCGLKHDAGRCIVDRAP